jgi:hypothetical protein
MISVQFCKPHRPILFLQDFSAFGLVVMMPKLRCTVSSGHQKVSQIPAKASGFPSCRAIA